MASSKTLDPYCSVARSLGVLGDRWMFLILREAFGGATRFAEFQSALGIARDVLADRLAALVEYGVMTKEPYQEPGQRSRDAYLLTDAGLDLRVVLGSLQQWGDTYLPRPGGPTIVRRTRRGARPVHVAFVDDRGRELDADDVVAHRTDQYPVRGG
ncbi:MAG: hypothetical protein QOF96_567 [Actinomycetota bacterium]|jgi:DNA-binding HxlR family transcriptional regulator|nr:hypothetical protein [Actinomycetota bacterium]